MPAGGACGGVVAKAFLTGRAGFHNLEAFKGLGNGNQVLTVWLAVYGDDITTSNAGRLEDG